MSSKINILKPRSSKVVNDYNKRQRDDWNRLNNISRNNMKKSVKSFSLVVLTRNSEKTVEENIIKINNYLTNLSLFENYEIIVSDYSEDKTFSILDKISKKINTIKPKKAPRKGIGCGIVSGIKNSIGEYVMTYPIDMAWDLQTIDKSITKLNEGYDVVLGSRNLEQSRTKRPLKRKIFSKGYNLLINLLFNLKIGDTQGTVALKKSDFMKYEKYLDDDGPFLQTEILIYSKKSGLKIKEVPSIVSDMRKDSTVSVLPFSISMMRKALKKKF